MVFVDIAVPDQEAKWLPLLPAETPGENPVFKKSREFVAANRESVQGLVDAWFDALAWIGKNESAAVAIMAKQGGVTPEEYAAYDAGTTILTREQNMLVQCHDRPFFRFTCLPGAEPFEHEPPKGV